MLKASYRPEYFHLSGYTADALIKVAARVQLVAESVKVTEDGATVYQGAEQSPPAQGMGAMEQVKSLAGAS